MEVVRFVQHKKLVPIHQSELPENGVGAGAFQVFLRKFKELVVQGEAVIYQLMDLPLLVLPHPFWEFRVAFGEIPFKGRVGFRKDNVNPLKKQVLIAHQMGEMLKNAPFVRHRAAVQEVVRRIEYDAHADLMLAGQAVFDGFSCGHDVFLW
jgi:hypothetical protein